MAKVSVTDLLAMRFPVRFACPGLGDLVVEPMTGDFETWAREGRSESSWSDGEAMARALLSMHARHAETETPTDPAAIAAMPIEALDTACDDFIDRSGQMFRPKLIGEGEGEDREIRDRRDNEAYPLERQDGEAGVDRLQRVIFAWLQDHDDSSQRLMDTIRPRPSTVEKMVRQTMGFDSIGQLGKSVSDLTRIAELDVFKKSRLLAERMYVPDISAIKAATLGLTAADQLYKSMQLAELTRVGDLSAVTAASRGLGAPDWMTGYRTAGIFESILGMEATKASALASLGISDTLLQAQKAAAIAALTPTWEDQLGFMTAANRSFNLGLSASALAAMTTVCAPDVGVVSRALTEAMSVPPGFQLTASLGLAGVSAHGVAADVLRHYDVDYDLEAEAGPDFTIVREATREFDQGGLDARQVDEILAVVHQTLKAEVVNERDSVRRIGRLAIFGHLMAFISMATGVIGLGFSSASYDLAKKTYALDEAAAHTDTDPAKIGPKLDQLNASILAQRAAPKDADDRVRYVHRVAPLRAEPDGSSLMIRMVYPDQQLRVLDEQGTWLKVEAFDYHSGAPVTGWLNRRPVRRTALEDGGPSPKVE